MPAMNDTTTASVTPERPQSSSSPISAGITIGFATAAGMWTLGYLLHFPGMSTPSAIVGVALLLAQGAGAALAGMLGPARSALRTGLTTGLTTGLLNLLILGSLLFEGSGEDSTARPASAVIVLGWLAFSIILGILGAQAGTRFGAAIRRAPEARDQSGAAWLGRFGVVGVVTMLPLLLVGSVVTTSDSGLAVPDWPGTFGSNMFLFPLSRMTGGVYFEHTHRLFGALVGLTALTLMVMTLRGSRCPRAKTLSVIVFVLIAIQGGIGGMRVTETSRGLALLHGVAAQGILALLVALAAMLSIRWNDGHEPVAAPGVRKLTRLAWITLVIVLIQIALGGLIRHFSGATLSMHSVITHAGWSLVAVAHVFFVSSRIGAIKTAPQPLRKIGVALLVIVGLQMLLGIVALGVAMMYQDRASAPMVRLVMGALHQTVGAVLLGCVALALVWIGRSLEDDGTSKKTAPA
jgi:cytochrome c oxidase assembly protein subunit 15